MGALDSFTGLTLTPLLPWPLLGPLLAGAALVGASLLVHGLWRGGRWQGGLWRLAALAILFLALLNPAIRDEDRTPLTDVALIVEDASASQAVGERAARTEAAALALKDKLGSREGVELRHVRVTDDEEGSLLMTAAEEALADVPRQRIAGVILVTDGQAHDAPAAGSLPEGGPFAGAPLHVLLTGKEAEFDRRLVIEDAPAYGIVGQDRQLTVRIEDSGHAPDEPAVPARLTVKIDGGKSREMEIAPGEKLTFPVRLIHGGPTVLELSTPELDGELTGRNNRALVSINGVRDRVKVLLVSGQPHMGERSWRDLLKSAPSVDLVHFTILRPPEKQDGTPINELSLIAFPIRELFETKLDEFDLIIFDRYRRRGVLPQDYLANIARFVTKGGALLESAGPAFASPLSLFRTPLSEVLPAKPTRRLHEGGFRPALSGKGRRHPVTARLPGGQEAGKESWGRWFRMVETDARRGDVIMTGPAERPLLVLDRVGEGRVAQLLSDHAWLWGKGFEGGGPQGELLRRLVHWLMKEPSLEENELRAEADGGLLTITRQTLAPTDLPVTVTLPSGETRAVSLVEGEAGEALATLPIADPGLYFLTDGVRQAVAAAGDPLGKEYADMRATAEALRPAIEASGGGVTWLARDGLPSLRFKKPGRDMTGRGWIALRANEEYLVTGLREIPLLPPFLLLFLAIGGLMAAWWREGR